MDDEIKGEGNSYAYADRSYDPRIGRWWSPDAFETVLASQSPYSFALNNPIYLVDEHGDYPKPSEILAKFGVELPPLAAGLLDGAFDGSPLGLIGFAADMTDPQFRSDMIDGFKALASDPIGSLKAMFSEYVDVLDRVLSGNATAEDEYFIGHELGSTVSGLLTGGAIKKTFDKLKTVRKGKLAEQALKKGDDLPQVTKNKLAGDLASDNIAKRYPGADREVSLPTTDGVRRIDVLTPDGVAIESKVGRTSLTNGKDGTMRQLLKDKELLDGGDVKEVVWEFTRSGSTGKIGPTPKLEAALKEAGIKIKINE